MSERKTSTGAWAGLGCLVFFFAMAVFLPSRSPAPSTSAPTTPRVVSPWEVDAVRTAEQKKLFADAVQAALDDGLINRYAYENGVMNVYVDSQFYRADIKDKKELAHVLLLYFHDAEATTSDRFNILDRHSGKRVGRMSSAFGFSMED